jgi:hypothetical protein
MGRIEPQWDLVLNPPHFLEFKLYVCILLEIFNKVLNGAVSKNDVNLK